MKKFKIFKKTGIRPIVLIAFGVGIAIITVMNALLFLKVDQSEQFSPNPFRVRKDERLKDTKITIWTILRDLPESEETYSQKEEDLSTWLGMIHTYNSLNSWIRLPNVKVLLYGTLQSCKFVGHFLDPSSSWSCLPIPCYNQEYNVPTYDCLFKNSSAFSNTEFMM